MINRLLVIVLISLFLTACQNTPVQDNWSTYKSRFIHETGRVIDTGNKGISHSEGQGYGLLLSVKNDDRESFDKIWSWAQNNLQVRDDNLFIWRRQPNTRLEDEDKNNASDGDVIIAWALFEASKKWKNEQYSQNALKIIHDIKKNLVVSLNGMEVLLPAEHGFQSEGFINLNLSYWVFPAFSVFSRYDEDPVWNRLQESGLNLLKESRFGQWKLPSDWIGVGYDKKIWATKDGRFSYDAIRIPLYLIWAGFDDEDLLFPFVKYWQNNTNPTPEWVELDNSKLGPNDAGSGIKSVKHLVFLQQKLINTANFETLLNQDYYQATLLQLSKLCYQQIQE